MLRTRVIPTLLLRGQGLVKGIKYKDHKYIGDPMNAIKIYNEKQADELVLLDIEAHSQGRCINPKQVELYASEARMPIAVGGGIKSIEDARTLLSSGAEKLCLNTSAMENPDLIRALAESFGSQCVVVSVDVKRNWFGTKVLTTRAGKKNRPEKLVDWLKTCEEVGAGEILINAIDREGTGEGYDLDMIRTAAAAVSIPVIANGGAANIDHFQAAVKDAGATAVAAGSMFVFQGPRRAVLISFPSREALDRALS